VRKFSGGGSWGRHAGRKDVRLSAAILKRGMVNTEGRKEENPFTMRTPK